MSKQLPRPVGRHNLVKKNFWDVSIKVLFFNLKSRVDSSLS